MKNKLFIMAVLALAAFGFSSSASAATVNFAPGAWFSVSNNYQPGNVDLFSVPLSTSEYSTVVLPQGTLTLSNATITSKSNDYWGAIPESVSGDQHFIAVDLSSGDNIPGSATFDLTSGANHFGFNWGSLDGYNFVSYTNNQDVSFTLSGDDIVNLHHLANFEDDFYFELFDLSGIKQIILSSDCFAMEVANVTLSEVPLPPAVALFGMALAGVFGARSRSRKTA